MKTIQLLTVGLMLLLFSTTSCIDDLIIRGNGIEATEARLTNHFSKVKSEGNFDVHISPGSEYDILIEAESNLIPYIETDVTGNTLRIYTQGLRNLRNQLPLKVFITMPYINAITQSGSGIITTGYFEGEHFNAIVSGSGIIETAFDANSVDGVVSGSGSVYISGTANNADFVVSGSGKIDAWDLSLRNCEATVSGSGSIWVNAGRFLKANISGSGNVFYNGAPAVESHISGSGNVIREN
ncbi:MAG TPA: head GIN domain-containing protein [Tangfeifania sp.]|nr:head GIN domain-containing protein [Tangfeifania sp.]